jgi:hypothetical protein
MAGELFNERRIAQEPKRSSLVAMRPVVVIGGIISGCSTGSQLSRPISRASPRSATGIHSRTATISMACGPPPGRSRTQNPT